MSSCGHCLIFFKAKEQQSREEAFKLGLIVLMVVVGTSLKISLTEIPRIKSQASDSGSRASVPSTKDARIDSSTSTIEGDEHKF